jgi:hypothetical protein
VGGASGDDRSELRGVGQVLGAAAELELFRDGAGTASLTAQHVEKRR